MMAQHSPLLLCFSVLLLAHCSLALTLKREAPSEGANGASGSEERSASPENVNEPSPVNLNQQQAEDGEEGGKHADAVYDATDGQPRAPTTNGGGRNSAEGSSSATSSAATETHEATTTAAERDGISSRQRQDEEGEGETARRTSSSETTATTQTQPVHRAPKKESAKGKSTKGTKAAAATISSTGGITATAQTGESSAAAATTQKATAAAAQRNCNSEQMRKLILENIHAKPSVAKRQIQAKIAAEINGKVDVICAKHAFSYIVNSELFCEAENNGVICLAFKQQG